MSSPPESLGFPNQVFHYRFASCVKHLPRPAAITPTATVLPPSPLRRTLGEYDARGGDGRLASQGGFLKHTLTREGVEQVMASAHGLAACTVVKDLSDAAEVWRCEMEAIEELRQIFEA